MLLEKEKIIPLPEDVFRLFRDLLSKYCGIYFDDDSRYLIERRLSRRVQMRGLSDFREYYRFLLYSKEKDDEMSEVIDILTVNETYFFREMNQLRAFIDEICLEIKSTKAEKRKLRIWSAGCASGEEPYTIAMLLLEKPEMLKGWSVEVIGSDINQRVLQKARKGVYGKNSFRSTEQYYINKYFERDEEEYRIKDEVRKLVDFSYINLLDPYKQQFLGDLDIIFCRNVLIYFHQDAKRKVIDAFAKRLIDGGYLLLGHAESLINVSTQFALKHLKNDMVYQKPKKSSVGLSDESLFRMVWGK